MEVTSYSRSFWSALFTFLGHGSVEFGLGRWELTTGIRSTTLNADEVTDVQIRRGFFWSTLDLVSASGRTEFPGLAHTEAVHLQGLFKVSRIIPGIIAATVSWDDIKKRKLYINNYAWSAWRAQHQDTRALLHAAELDWFPPADRAQATAFIETFDSLADTVSRLNLEHIERELRECKVLLDSVETKPLTKMQRTAIITDEDNTLVIAGAGTGKTSVVVGKAAYLLKRLRVRPDDILLLAYNKDAASEMRERVSQRVGVDLTVSTFHALGLRIIGQVEGAKPSLSKLAEGKSEPATFIEGIVREMLRDPRWRSVLIPYLVGYLKPYQAPENFTTKHGYIGYLKGADIVSLRGEQVRSHEECTIANWLFVNGIDYEYERPYEHDERTAEHRQYKPDFFISQARVYLEHFGVDRAGNTAPWVPKEEYKRGMEWKRATHRRHRTRLIETYSYDHKEGALTERLAQRLADVGVHPRPRTPEELESVLDRQGTFTVLSKILSTFLQHFKERQHTVAELRSSTNTQDPQRARCFLLVFEHVYEAYQRALQTENAIDFQDMIRRAADHVIAGRYQSPYSYILVDEFQDTSRGRAKLLRFLLDNMPNRRLMCVGDDWQSVYRFAGSDITHMTRFSDHFGYTASVGLDESFRFGARLLKASTKFIQKNPAQLRKTLRSSREEGVAPIVIVALPKKPLGDDERDRYAVEQVQTVLGRIEREHTGSSKASVLLLGRYNFNRPAIEFGDLADGFPRLSVEFLTVHRAKGLQADYVVVIEAISGRFGFPSGVEDDPLLSMVLAEPDALEYAEERRLFYVALTRASRRVFILTRDSQRSAFVEEILGPEYIGLVEGPEGWSERIACPDCSGTLTKRLNSKSGKPFWSCVDYPYCEGSAEVCAVCQRGALVLDGLVYCCSEKGCPGRVEVCPQCREGQLLKRTNKKDKSEFWACSRWNNGQGCKYTRNVLPRQIHRGGRRR